MTYKYEHRLRNYLIGHTNVNPKFDGFEILKSLDELKEVYRKARAWKTLKEEKIKSYTGLRTLILKGYEDPSDIYYLGVFADELKRMDELDGTNEFSNLLSDLEDE